MLLVIYEYEKHLFLEQGGPSDSYYINEQSSSRQQEEKELA
jgi:hypothetical protein